jgi:hypothetical protein
LRQIEKKWSSYNNKAGKKWETIPKRNTYIYVAKVDAMGTNFISKNIIKSGVRNTRKCSHVRRTGPASGKCAVLEEISTSLEKAEAWFSRRAFRHRFPPSAVFQTCPAHFLSINIPPPSFS